MKYIYLYGMVMTTESFLLYDKFPTADGYGEIKERYYLLGGETGTAAAILESMGEQVKVAGTHIGTRNASIIKEYFDGKNIDCSELKESEFEGAVDYVIIDQNTRTCFGEWGKYFTRTDSWYEKANELSIANCSVAGIDPFWGSEAVEYCKKYNKKYATIDCPFDSEFNKGCEINAISHQYLKSTYPGIPYEELFAKYTEQTEGLIIFTFGENDVMYGRKGEDIKHFKPFSLDIVSTLGAGDSFKAGTIFALNHGMSDDKIVEYACAVAGAACTRFPIPLYPPTRDIVESIIKNKE